MTLYPVVVATCGLALLAGTAGSTLAAPNNQSGLINVNLDTIVAEVPISVALPIGVAANVCNVSVIELKETGATKCDAQNTSNALSNAVAKSLVELN